MNPLKRFIKSNNQPNVIGMALAAKMSGQTPEQFLQSQLGNLPQLKGLDLSNLEKAAKELCNQQGIDPTQMIQNAENILNK